MVKKPRRAVKPFALRISPALYRAIKAAADREDPPVSVNYIIERTLIAAFLERKSV